jgi:hypothetical protein
MRFGKVLVAAAAVTCAVSISSPVRAAPVVFENTDVKLTDYGGEANNGLTTFGGYFAFVDKAFSNEETTWSVDPLVISPTGLVTVLSNGSAGGFGSPNAAGTSTATVGALAVSATTTLFGRTATTVTTFTLPQGGSLAGYKFVFYAENDIFGAQDSAAFQGSIAGGNLRLNQYDTTTQSLTVVLTPGALVNATLTSFGSGKFTGFGEALATGNLSVLSTDGSNFDTSGDLGQALAFSLSGTTASVTVNYRTQSIVPEPGALGLIGIGALALIRRRRSF